jgi:DNA ligase-1
MTAAQFKPMLAKDGDVSKLKWPQMIQPKLDGIRASVVNGRLVSRSLKLIPNDEIQDALGRPEFEGLDGELIVGDPRDPSCFQRTTSYVRGSSKTGGDWTYYVFDLWNRGVPFKDRLEAMDEVEHLWPDNIKQVATAVVLGPDALDVMERMLLEDGYEGAILRDPDALYKFGRSGKTGPLIKVKRFVDYEAEVIGVYEEMHNGNVAKTNELGRTERSSHAAGKIGKGTLGGLILRGLPGTPAEGVEFRCGTGFDAAQRRDLWSEAISVSAYGGADAGLNGRIAKVKSFPVGVKDKPRHPVFLGWREEWDR